MKARHDNFVDERFTTVTYPFDFFAISPLMDIWKMVKQGGQKTALSWPGISKYYTINR
jgi:hypothetical protein